MEPDESTPFVVDNLRLEELVAVVRQNKPFFDAFTVFLKEQGYADVFSFICEADESRAKQTLTDYLEAETPAQLFDGLGRPYPNAKAKWYLLAWLLRDAPAQRLEPLLKQSLGDSQLEKTSVSDQSTS